MASESKERMITLSHNGLVGGGIGNWIRQREREAEKWRAFVESVWGYLVIRTSERVGEIRSMLGGDVQKRLEKVRAKYIRET